MSQTIFQNIYKNPISFLKNPKKMKFNGSANGLTKFFKKKVKTQLTLQKMIKKTIIMALIVLQKNSFKNRYFENPR